MRRLLPAAGLPVVLMALAVAGCGGAAATRSSSAAPTAPTAPSAPATPTTPTTQTAPTAPTTPTGPTNPTTPGTPTTPTTPAPPPRPAGPRLAGRLTVSPLIGRPSSTERFAITLAQAGPVTASAGHLRARLELSATRVSPPRPANGCASGRVVALTAPAPSQTRTATLGPSEGGSSGSFWCRGVFSAQVQELERPVCQPGQMCPQFIRLVGVLGPVRFRIR